MTVEEKLVEQHFTDTIRRQPDGRYVVTLPVFMHVIVAWATVISNGHLQIPKIIAIQPPIDFEQI
jgi:hypothetical protein